MSEEAAQTLLAPDVEPEGSTEDAKLEGDTKAEGTKPEGDTKAEGTKPEGDTKAEGTKPEGDAKAEGTKPEGAPEAYEPFTLPEGMEVNEEVLADFSAYAKERNFTQAQAQEIADFGARIAEGAAEKTLAAVQAEHAKTVEAWGAETQKDPELAKHEGGTKAAIGLAVKAVEALGGDELKKVLNETGLGNHKTIVSAFFKVGKVLQQDQFMFGGAPQETERSVAQKLYPNMK